MSYDEQNYATSDTIQILESVQSIVSLVFKLHNVVHTYVYIHTYVVHMYMYLKVQQLTKLRILYPKEHTHKFTY